MSSACCQASRAQRVSGEVVAVAEVAENVCFAEAVAEFPDQAEGALVAKGGCGWAAKQSLDMA